MPLDNKRVRFETEIASCQGKAFIFFFFTILNKYIFSYFKCLYLYFFLIWGKGVSPDELAWVSEKLQGTDNLIPVSSMKASMVLFFQLSSIFSGQTDVFCQSNQNNFQCTAPPQREFETAQSERKTFHHANPQTLALLNILELPYVLDFGAIEQEEVITYVAERDVDNPEEINIDDNDVNPEEIHIDDDDVNPEEIEI